MLMMIEIKTPLDLEVRKRYRVHEVIEILHGAIQARDLAKFCIAHSFDHEALKIIEKVNQTYMTQCSRPEIRVETLYLQNFYFNYPCSSIESMQSEQGSGCHAQIHSLTREIVEQMHESGKIVAVWIDLTAPKDLYEENEAFY